MSELNPRELPHEFLLRKYGLSINQLSNHTKQLKTDLDKTILDRFQNYKFEPDHFQKHAIERIQKNQHIFFKTLALGILIFHGNWRRQNGG